MSGWWVARVVLLASVVALGGCAKAVNYTDPAGPRHAGVPRVPRSDCGVAPDTLRIAAWNTAYSRHVEGLIDRLTSDSALRRADVVVLEEADEVASERIADALGLYWVYYPAVHHPVPDKDFGNALLSCWPIADDAKLVLPHLSWTRRAQRVAVLGTVQIGTQRVRVVAVHFATPFEVSPHSQRDQAEAVLAAIGDWSHVVVAGDFNRPDLGSLFERDGYAWSTRGLGSTFHGVDIDHVVARGFATVARGRVDASDVSDHSAVWADLAISSR